MNGFFNYMDCSTRHITDEVCENILSIESLCVDTHSYGWWVFVANHIEADVPQCLRDVLLYASANNAEWVKLDCDGWVHDVLPKYNSSWVISSRWDALIPKKYFH